MTAQADVAKFLLDLAAKHGARFDMPMSRRQMADDLGLPVERVCRILTHFAEARIIAIPNVSEVEIIDRAALEAVANTPC